MAYDKNLAQRLRDRLADHPAVSERQMFGGIGFMIGGNMAVGVTGNELIVRVGPQAHDEAIALPGARMFDLSGRPSAGWLVVGPEGFTTGADFESWVRRGVDFAESLPPK